MPILALTGWQNKCPELFVKRSKWFTTRRDLTAKSATCAEKASLYNASITDFARNFVSLDLLDMSDSDFENWLHDASRLVSGSAVSEDRLVELVSTTLREVVPEARARGFIDLANLCYAMADKTLGSQQPESRCLEIVVSVSQRQ